MGKKRLDPGAVAKWYVLFEEIEEGFWGKTKAQRTAVTQKAAIEGSVSEQHVKRLLHGVRFIMGLAQSDPMAANALKKSSYNVTDVISRWHKTDARAACGAAIAYHQGKLTLADLRRAYQSGKETVPHNLPKRDWAAPSASYADLSPFGRVKTYAGGERGLGVVILPQCGKSAEERILRATGMIIMAERIGLPLVVTGPDPAEVSQIRKWARSAKCRHVEFAMDEGREDEK